MDASPIVKRRRLEAPAATQNEVLPLQIHTPSAEVTQTLPLQIHYIETKPCSGMKILYLFAGQERKASIANLMKKLGATVLEVDILRNSDHDLTKSDKRRYYLDHIKSGTWDVVITSPPCDTFSRAKYANLLGPRPTRSLEHPRGLPNLPKALFLRNQLGNILADFSWDACLTQLQFNPSGFLVKEHPEDLGCVQYGPFAGCSPAAIWQAPQHQECIKLGALSVGIRQSDFGTPYVKPTRLLLKLGQDCKLPQQFFVGVPEFSEDRSYLGPIPRAQGTTSLIRREGDTSFRTTGTAAWPPRLCSALADLLQSAWARRNISTMQTAPTQTTTNKVPTTSDRNFPAHLPPADFSKGGKGEVRKIIMANKTYDFHDGLGLTSPGRFDKRQRTFPEGLRWQTLRNDIVGVLGHMDDTAVMKALVALALGRGDHFDENWPKKMRDILHRWLQKQAGDYEKTDHPSTPPDQPFHLSLIQGLLREGLDGDYKIFDEFITGVNLGVLSPLPRTPAIYEEHAAWRLEENPFAIRQEQKQNYKSLSEHVETVREQFEADLLKGRMENISKAEYERRYLPDARAISALAALQEKTRSEP